jgi:hypothetical protein
MGCRWRPAAAVEIELANGVQIRVPADQPAALVTTLRTVGTLAVAQQQVEQEALRC